MEIWSVKVKVISKHSGEKGMTENAFVQKKFQAHKLESCLACQLNLKKLVLKSGFPKPSWKQSKNIFPLKQ